MESKMRRTKNKKDELKSEEAEKKTKSQSSKKVEPVVSFDAYFRKMMSENQKVQSHHKAPMKAYAKRHDMLNGTLKEFEKLFSSY